MLTDMKLDDLAHGAPISPQGKAHTAWHRISVEPGYLRSELFNRRTVDETRKFLEAVRAEALKHRLPQVLICVRNSAPIFTVERYGFSRYLDLAFESKYKIALVGDSLELRIAHQYVATMARMRGAKVRAFPHEAAAINWLVSGEDTSGTPQCV
jgi:hypothetical protein